jgi:hypothetical protein
VELYVQQGLDEGKATKVVRLEEASLRLDAEFVEVAGPIQRDLGAVIERVENGNGVVNSLGEIRAQGSRLDILCARRPDAHEHLKTIRSLLGVTAPAHQLELAP